MNTHRYWRIARKMVMAWATIISAVTPVLAQQAPTGGDSSRFTTNRSIVPATQRLYSFPDEGVFISTEFQGARINQVEQTGPSAFRLTVAPENAPINNSGWYAFRIWSRLPQKVRVTLEYQDGTHRYAPQVSRDGEHWELLKDSNGAPGEAHVSFSFDLALGPEPLYVAGQELFTSEDFDRWIEGLERRSFVRSRELGKSTLGKPIRALEVGEAGPEAEYVLIIGRQHPPEVTGTVALREFVEILCADTPQAEAYRKRFRTVVVPLVNPDGVDAGHWRHNVHGVDLNRDWGQFNQVETRVVRDEFLRLKALAPGRIRFGLDFHSTRKDVFYITSDEDDLARQWLRQLQQRTPEYKVVIEGSPNPGNRLTLTAASWMRKELGIPSLTYESGDNTPRELIRKVAGAGARELMQLLASTPVGIGVAGCAEPLEAMRLLSETNSAAIKVALYKGVGTGGAGPTNVMRYLNSGTNAVVVQVTPEQIRNGVLKAFDVVIFGGGSASKQAETITELGREQVVEFVRNGGGYLGICAGAYLATSGYPWSLKIMDARTPSPKWRRGVGKVKLELTDAGRRMLRDTPEVLEVLYANGPILVRSELPELEDFETLAYFRSELAENDSPAGIMVDSPALVAGKFGKGRVVCFSPHPEQTKGLEDFVEKALLWIRAGDQGPDQSH